MRISALMTEDSSKDRAELGEDTSELECTCVLAGWLIWFAITFEDFELETDTNALWRRKKYMSDLQNSGEQKNEASQSFLSNILRPCVFHVFPTLPLLWLTSNMHRVKPRRGLGAAQMISYLTSEGKQGQGQKWAQSMNLWGGGGFSAASANLNIGPSVHTLSQRSQSLIVWLNIGTTRGGTKVNLHSKMLWGEK